jgi:hypothetical protein
MHGDSLCLRERLDGRHAVESAKARCLDGRAFHGQPGLRGCRPKVAYLHASMRQIGFVVDGRSVDMNLYTS